MKDNTVLSKISELVDEEHRLLEQRKEGQAGEDIHRRIADLEVELDQCWDFLRQRRAARESGRDEDTVAVRDARTVERYQQ